MTKPKHNSAIDRAALGDGAVKKALRNSSGKIERTPTSIADIIAGHGSSFDLTDLTGPVVPPIRAAVRPDTGAEIHRPGASPPSKSGENQAARIGTVADIGEMVKAARARLGMSQQRFADMAGVGRRFVSELEAGKFTIEVERMLRCCHAAGIDILARPRNQ